MNEGRCDLRLLSIAIEDIDAWAQTLDPGEVARSQRFRFDADRRRFIVGRGLLRQMLGRVLGVAPPSLRFEANAHGKPVLVGVDGRVGADGLMGAAGLAFNVAHSGDHVLVGVAQAEALGVDIELHRSDFDVTALGRRVFTPAEQRQIANGSTEPQVEGFFRQWVFKEAVVKGVGMGLSLDLKRFEIAFDGERATLVSHGVSQLDPAADWRLQTVAAPPGYSAALAIRTGA